MDKKSFREKFDAIRKKPENRDCISKIVENSLRDKSASELDQLRLKFAAELEQIRVKHEKLIGDYFNQISDEE